MRRRRSTFEFFLCFSSRSSSSSSMKISSKSILSPGRTREPTLSISSSLSRRLSRRSNGSMKGGGQAGQASPMFATGGVKKKGQGGSFEPAEPSSPKVTCIGQVRVKSKKKHGRNKLRNGSQRRNGEVSFRKTEQNQGQQECLPHRNQRWVHLPLSICETLRAFGAEFNCFVPCGGRSSSSCSWSCDREKVEKRRGSGCGAVFARWLFAMQESEDKGRKIEHEQEHEHGHVESVVRDHEDEHVINRGNRGYREVGTEIEMEILEEKIITKMESFKEEEEAELEEARNSICTPPKNALLLMRSRSAPFRMSSLANRFWDSPSAQDKDVEDDSDLDEDEEGEEEGEDGQMLHNASTEQKQETDVQVDISEDETGCGEAKDEDLKEHESPLKGENERQKPQIRETEQQEEILSKDSTSPDAFEVIDNEEETKLQVQTVKGLVEKKEERRVSFSSSTVYFGPESETEFDSESDSGVEEEEEEEIEEALEERITKSTEEEEVSVLVSVSVSEEEKEVLSGSTSEEVQEEKVKDKEEEEQEEEEDEKSLLPECLLLMMYEPKLSMEVSKETWVCSRDFIRSRHSEKKNLQKKDGDESTKKRLSTDSNPMLPPQHSKRPPQKPQLKQSPVQIQPPRSSCSKVEPLVAKAIERKANNAGAYEPFVLKRCKSEPMRNSAKLAPEVCFWQKNKLETHQPPTLGVGATGIGF